MVSGYVSLPGNCDNIFAFICRCVGRKGPSPQDEGNERYKLDNAMFDMNTKSE